MRRALRHSASQQPSHIKAQTDHPEQSPGLSPHGAIKGTFVETDKRPADALWILIRSERVRQLMPQHKEVQWFCPSRSNAWIHFANKMSKRTVESWRELVSSHLLRTVQQVLPSCSTQTVLPPQTMVHPHTHRLEYPWCAITLPVNIQLCAIFTHVQYTLVQFTLHFFITCI